MQKQMDQMRNRMDEMMKGAHAGREEEKARTCRKCGKSWLWAGGKYRRAGAGRRHVPVPVPLLLGFALGGASAFTAAFSRLWGEAGAGGWPRWFLRNWLAIPLWLFGFVTQQSGQPPLSCLFAARQA